MTVPFLWQLTLWLTVVVYAPWYISLGIVISGLLLITSPLPPKDNK